MFREPDNFDTKIKRPFSRWLIHKGLLYQGQVKDGVPEGRGVYIWPKNCIGIGYFREGKMHGNFIQITASGDKVIESFIHGRQHGLKSHKFSRGGTVTEHYDNGKKLK